MATGTAMAAGTGTAKNALEFLGISAEDAAGHIKNSDQIMVEVADKFANMENGAGKTAMAIDIFGKCLGSRRADGGTAQRLWTTGQSDGHRLHQATHRGVAQSESAVVIAVRQTVGP